MKLPSRTSSDERKPKRHHKWRRFGLFRFYQPVLTSWDLLLMSDANEHLQSNRNFYDRISHSYDLIADAGEHKAREAGEIALGVENGEKVLEVGCGTGRSLVHFSKQAGQQGRVVGLDVSTGMLSVAKGRAEKEATNANIEFVEADARQLDPSVFVDNSFDAAFASFTLELFPLEDIPTVLNEVKRILKPDGRIGIVSMSVVKEPDHPSMLERAYVWMHRHFPHLVDCQPIDVHGHLKSAGFEIQSSEEIKIWTMPVSVVVAVPVV